MIPLRVRRTLVVSEVAHASAIARAGGLPNAGIYQRLGLRNQFRNNGADRRICHACTSLSQAYGSRNRRIGMMYPRRPPTKE